MRVNSLDALEILHETSKANYHQKMGHEYTDDMVNAVRLAFLVGMSSGHLVDAYNRCETGGAERSRYFGRMALHLAVEARADTFVHLLLYEQKTWDFTQVDQEEALATAAMSLLC